MSLYSNIGLISKGSKDVATEITNKKLSYRLANRASDSSFRLTGIWLFELTLYVGFLAN